MQYATDLRQLLHKHELVNDYHRQDSKNKNFYKSPEYALYTAAPAAHPFKLPFEHSIAISAKYAANTLTRLKLLIEAENQSQEQIKLLAQITELQGELDKYIKANGRSGLFHIFVIKNNPFYPTLITDIYISHDKASIGSPPKRPVSGFDFIPRYFNSVSNTSEHKSAYITHFFFNQELNKIDTEDSQALWTNLKGSFQFEWGTQRKSGDSFWFSKAFQDIYNSESIWSKGCSNISTAPLLYEGKQQVYRGELYLEGTINHPYLPKGVWHYRLLSSNQSAHHLQITEIYEGAELKAQLHFSLRKTVCILYTKCLAVKDFMNNYYTFLYHAGAASRYRDYSWAYAGSVL